MTALLEKEKQLEATDAGDHDLFSHYCKKADIERAILAGAVITALCGKKWTPTRDFTKFPVCPDCKRMLDEVWPV